MYQVERTISRKELQGRLEEARCMECGEEFALHLIHQPQYFCSMMCETDYLIRQNGDVWSSAPITKETQQMLEKIEQNEKELPF